MADHDEAQIEFGDEVLQQVQHLRLHRDIQRRDRFIADDQPGPAGQGAGDGDALALAAGEFMRPAIGHLRPQPHPGEQIRHPHGAAGAGHAGVQDQRFLDGGGHAHPRVEAAKGVLKDDLGVFAPRPQRLAGQRRNILAIEADFPAIRLDQPQRHPAQGGFAAAALADNGQHLARHHMQAHAIHRAHRATRPAQSVAHREMLGHIGEFEQRRHAAASSGAFQQAT